MVYIILTYANLYHFKLKKLIMDVATDEQIIERRQISYY